MAPIESSKYSESMIQKVAGMIVVTIMGLIAGCAFVIHAVIKSIT